MTATSGLRRRKLEPHDALMTTGFGSRTSLIPLLYKGILVFSHTHRGKIN
jgi:hypothetical protein